LNQIWIVQVNVHSLNDWALINEEQSNEDYDKKPESNFNVRLQPWLTKQ